MAGVNWTDSTIEAGGTKICMCRAPDKGRPLVVLHHETGTLDRLPFYDALAAHYDVLVPHHPGYGRSERPTWMRSVRDIAVVYRGLLSELKIAKRRAASAWASAAGSRPRWPAWRRAICRIWCWSAPMGIKPPQGDILDHAHHRLHRLCPRRLPRPEGVRRGLRRGAVDRPARDVGHLPRDELPHRLEALHVQPDAAASAGRACARRPWSSGATTTRSCR